MPISGTSQLQRGTTFGRSTSSQTNFQVYKGSDEILLSKLILDPTHSILKQSFDSRLRLVRSPRDCISRRAS